jgi:hypothetical protein
MSAGEQQFFSAQNVNQMVAVNTSWLTVGHMDEVVSPCSDGKHIAVADPDMAMGLMLLAESEDSSAPMCQGMNYIGHSQYPAAGVPVDTALNDQRLNLEYYNDQVVMSPNYLPSIVSTVASDAHATVNLWTVTAQGTNNGEVLTKAMAFTAYLSGPRYYMIQFTDSQYYYLYYRDSQQANWTLDTVDGEGSIDADKVFPSAEAFILKTWWGGSAAAAKGDTFTFSADPNDAVVGIPVLFYDPESALTPPSSAFTCNCVNTLVDGSTIIVPQPFGPQVNGADVFEQYAEAAYTQCGYQNIEFVDARYYNNNGGDVHCATNVVRQLPAGNWW